MNEDSAARGRGAEHAGAGGSPLEEPTISSHETLERDAAGAALAHAAEEGIVGTSPLERTGAEADGLALEPERELMTINMGPHHPATHGVLRLVVELEGEVVKDLKPVVGYVHTGIEKNCEDKSYWKVIPFVERMDYLSYFFNMQSFCSAVETLL